MVEFPSNSLLKSQIIQKDAMDGNSLSNKKFRPVSRGGEKSARESSRLNRLTMS